MAGEKYVVAAADNPLQIAVRNILNPRGYVFVGNCGDSISLLRLVRSNHPDFAVIDVRLPVRDFRATVETLDDEMLCACIFVGEYKNDDIAGLIEKSRCLSYCPLPLSRDLLVHTVELSMLNYKRVSELNRKLKEMTESYETRKAVERAKWILIERDNVSETEAYERMRKKSMDSRLSMKAIADAIIFTHEMGRKEK